MRGLGPQLGDQLVLGQADGDGQPEEEQDDHQTGDPEGREGGDETADREGIPDQTGQDRPRSAKAGQDIDEAVETEGACGLLPPPPGLAAHQRVGQPMSGEGDGKQTELD